MTKIMLSCILFCLVEAHDIGIDKDGDIHEWQSYEKLQLPPFLIIKQSQDITTSLHAIDSIVSITAPPFIFSEQKLELQYKDKTKKEVQLASIWGFTNKKGTLFRYYVLTKRIYKVKFIGPIIIYVSNERFNPTYFSTSLDGDLFRCSDKNLREYCSEEQLNQLKENYKKVYKHYFKVF